MLILSLRKLRGFILYGFPEENSLCLLSLVIIVVHVSLSDKILISYCLNDKNLTLWEKITIKCRRTNRVRGDVVQTIQSWEVDHFQCAILNHTQKLIPGFLFYTIWKERNRCIFKGEINEESDIWNRFRINILETLLVQYWMNQYLLALQVDIIIFDGWEFGTLESLTTSNPNKTSLSN